LIVFIRLILTIALPVLIGYMALSALFRSREDLSALERLALAFGLGTGILAAEMLVLSRVGTGLSILSVLLANLIIFAPVCVFAARKRLVVFDFDNLVRMPSMTLLEKALIASIALKMLYVFFESQIKPVLAWDAFAHWCFTARVIFEEKGIPAFLFEIPGAGAHIRNQLSPLLQSWIFTGTGEWNEILGKIIFPLFFLALTLLFYAALRRNAGRTKALLFTFCLTAMPFLTFHATVEYSEIIATFFAFSGVLMMIRFTDKLDVRYLGLATVLFILGYFTKDEGLLQMFSAAVVFGCFALIDKRVAERFGRRTQIIAVCAAGAVFALALGFLIFGENYGSIIFAKSLEMERIPQIIYIFSSKMFMSGNWGLAWIAFALALVHFVSGGPRRDQALALAVVGLNILLFAAYYFTAEQGMYNWLFNGTTLSRNLLQFTPLALFFAAKELS